MRWGTAQAIHHARHRSAFGKTLVEQPAMQNVLADLAIESEAATTLALRMARAYDEDDSAFRRLATAVSKYWVCKRASGHANEALECLGGNGYVEESGMPRLYRDAPLNSIWEGSGNVAALDVLRAMVKEPEGLPAFLEEVELASGANEHLDAHVARLKAAPIAEDPQFGARRTVEDLGLALQASLLVRHAPAEVSDAFCASRLGGGGHAYGTLPSGVNAAAIIDRALAPEAEARGLNCDAQPRPRANLPAWQTGGRGSPGASWSGLPLPAAPGWHCRRPPTPLAASAGASGCAGRTS